MINLNFTDVYSSHYMEITWQHIMIIQEVTAIFQAKGNILFFFFFNWFGGSERESTEKIYMLWVKLIERGTPGWRCHLLRERTLEEQQVLERSLNTTFT